MMSRDSFFLRLVTVTLEDGTSEVLATNLPRDKFPQEKFGEIYHMRWGIETAYEVLKDRLKIENFTGVKPTLLKQDAVQKAALMQALYEEISSNVVQTHV